MQGSDAHTHVRQGYACRVRHTCTCQPPLGLLKLTTVITHTCMCRDLSMERLKSQLASSDEQLASQTQQLDALRSSYTQQTAQLLEAQSSVTELQTQVRLLKCIQKSCKHCAC